MATQVPTGNQSRDVQETIEGAREGLRHALDRGSERAAHLKDAAFERASHYKDIAMERGRSALSTIERTIDERPFMFMGGVFLGGIVLGFLLSRR
jgi:ElaB/YqjD/DUF883 family membrane-anchored ribosome-binding protein